MDGFLAEISKNQEEIDLPLGINNEFLEKVANFKYLGSTISEKNGFFFH